MEQDTQAQLMISHEAQAQVLADIIQRPQIEACGVLLGSINEEHHWHVEEAYPLPNIFDSPVYFEFAPEDLLMVELQHPGRVIGVYHSHPTGYPQASSTDRQNMQRVNREQRIPWAWLIVCGPFDQAFVKRHQDSLADVPALAYHHYARAGLCQITIQLQPRGASRSPSSS